VAPAARAVRLKISVRRISNLPTYRRLPPLSKMKQLARR
jgi:hypothetical protein